MKIVENNLHRKKICGAKAALAKSRRKFRQSFQKNLGLIVDPNKAVRRDFKNLTEELAIPVHLLTKAVIQNPVEVSKNRKTRTSLDKRIVSIDQVRLK